MRMAICLVVVMLAACGVRTKTLMEADDESRSHAPHNRRVCLLAGNLPETVQAKQIGHINATKGSYGSQEGLMVPIANAARKIGADAVTNLQSGQRIKGPLPWRVTAPTGDGDAMAYQAGSPPIDCAAAGGRLY